MSAFRIERRGLLLVLSSPSGAGKTTISRLLLERDRPMRPGEEDGSDYNFVDPTEFNLMVNRHEFLEHAKVFDNYYGTPRASVEEALSNGSDVIFDIDWQGAQQLGEVAGDDLVRVFILPPSTDELYRRLNQRAQDSDEVVETRMARAADEMSHWAEYDFIIINEDIEVSVGRVQSILMAERLRRQRQVGLSDFVKRLQEGY